MLEMFKDLKMEDIQSLLEGYEEIQKMIQLGIGLGDQVLPEVGEDIGKVIALFLKTMYQIQATDEYVNAKKNMYIAKANDDRAFWDTYMNAFNQNEALVAELLFLRHQKDNTDILKGLSESLQKVVK